MQSIKAGVVPIAFLMFALCFPIFGYSGGGDAVKAAKEAVAKRAETRAYLMELMRLGARKPFLTDSIDVYLEPDSLNRFFTVDIYRKLQGNEYFGYRFDEGFAFDSKEMQIETIKNLTSKTSCVAAYRHALTNALGAAGFESKPKAKCHVGVCIVGIEEHQTAKTLPGVMVEAYLRNTETRKTFFIRYGEGSGRGLAAAIRLSAEMLVSELEVRGKTHERKRTR
jgi:hypothetical protein